MLLSIIRYIKGYVRIRIIGFSTERFLNACSNKGIYIWGLQPFEGAYELYISISGLRKLKPIIRKTRTKVAIIGRFGLPFFLHRYRKRKIFFFGAFLCVLSIYILSLHIWDIDVRGNFSRSDETILEFMEQKHIVHGIRKSKVNCARIVKDIRKKFEDIIWVSASVEGTRLVIQVKENEDSLPIIGDGSKESSPAMDIIADRDCVITEIVTRNGVPAVKKGDTVKKGDILVCGRIPIQNDAGETIAFRYLEANADIRGQTTLSYEREQPVNYAEKQYLDKEKEELYLRLGKVRIGLGSRSHKYRLFEVSSQEKKVKIGESFYLPISFGNRIIKPYTLKQIPYKEEKIQELLTRKFNRYCKELEKKGVEIIQNDVKIYTGSDKAVSKGNLTVIMPMGETSPTQIIEIPTPENEMSGE